jgi:nucleoside diphosphate kinase
LDLEYGVLVAKSEAVKRDKESDIYEMLEDVGMHVEGTLDFEIDEDTAGRIYAHVSHKKKYPEGYPGTIVRGIEEYWEEGENVEVAVIRGMRLHERLEQVIGDHPHPEKNPEGSIRREAYDGDLRVTEEEDFDAEKYEVAENRERQEAGVRNLVHFPEADETLQDGIDLDSIEEDFRDEKDLEDLKEKYHDDESDKHFSGKLDEMEDIEDYDPNTFERIQFALEKGLIDGQIAMEEDREFENELERDAQIFLNIDPEGDVQEALRRKAREMERPDC